MRFCVDQTAGECDLGGRSFMEFRTLLEQVCVVETGITVE